MIFLGKMRKHQINYRTIEGPLTFTPGGLVSPDLWFFQDKLKI